MSDAIEITIPAGPAYSISPNSRSHWRVKHREAQELKQVTRYACPDEVVVGPVNLHWTVYLGKGRRLCDRDNITATLKPAMDGLVAERVIFDDNQDVVRAITVDQVKWSDHKGDARIVVRIEAA